MDCHRWQWPHNHLAPRPDELDEVLGLDRAECGVVLADPDRADHNRIDRPVGAVAEREKTQTRGSAMSRRRQTG